MSKHIVDETPLHEQYAEGLRKLADLIEANPDLTAGFRYSLTQAGLSWAALHSEDQAAGLAGFTRAAMKSGAKVEKRADGDAYFDVIASYGPVKVKGWASRNEVCEAVVVGQETVKVRQMPPREEWPEVEETRDIVRYDCKPILAGGAS